MTVELTPEQFLELTSDLSESLGKAMQEVDAGFVLLVCSPGANKIMSTSNMPPEVAKDMIRQALKSIEINYPDGDLQ